MRGAYSPRRGAGLRRDGDERTPPAGNRGCGRGDLPPGCQELMAWLIVQHGYDCKELYDLAVEKYWPGMA